jgi:hypothetical protein
MVRVLAGLVGVVVAGSLVGCAGSPSGGLGTAPRRTGTPEVHASWTSCQREVPREGWQSADAAELPRLGTGFEPVTAVVCTAEPVRQADGSTDLVAVEGRTTGIGDLLRAVRLADEPLTDHMCTMDLPLVAWFGLLDAQGRWVRPGVPTDRCGKIRIEVRDAVAALQLTIVSRTVFSEIESAEAAASGCSQGWANMVTVETAGGSALGPATTNPLAGADQIRLCRYRVPPSEQTSTKPGGEFEHGLVLTADRRAVIEQLLLSGGPARSCTLSAGRFALLRAVDSRGGEIYVELDGCQRVLVAPLVGRPSLAQATPALIQALLP